MFGAMYVGGNNKAEALDCKRMYPSGLYYLRFDLTNYDKKL
jgi:hypothetical protein